MKLSDFAEQTEKNDRAIQMALRETDLDVVAEYLVAIPADEREIIYRNMSERARGLLAEEVANLEGTVSSGQSHRAEQFFLQRLSRFITYTSREEEPLPDSPPEIELATDDAVVKSLIRMCRYERARGTLSLEAAVNSASDPIARKGLQMTIDGWDHVEKRAILERMKETYLSSISHTIDILIAGMECLGGDEHMLVVEERLNAFLPSNVAR